MLKLAADGSKIWGKTLSSDVRLWIRDLESTSDDGFVFVGQANFSDPEESETSR